MSRSSYLKKFKDPRWQKKRLEVFERDKFICQGCMGEDETLHIHHRYYNPKTDPWDYPPEALVTLCEDCHEMEKDNWFFEIKVLNKMLKKHFLSTELHCLQDLFDGVKFYHFPYIVINAVDSLLTDETKQRKLVEDYFAHLKSIGEG